MATAAIALLLSGCSGLSVLMTRNLSGEDLSLTILSNEPHHGEGYEKQVSDGGEIETLRWFHHAPDWIEVTVKLGNGTVKRRKWARGDYPPSMQKGTSAPINYVLEIRADGMVMRDPNRWDAVRWNPLGYSFLALWPLGMLAGIVLAVRRRVQERRRFHDT